MIEIRCKYDDGREDCYKGESLCLFLVDGEYASLVVKGEVDKHFIFNMLDTLLNSTDQEELRTAAEDGVERAYTETLMAKYLDAPRPADNASDAEAEQWIKLLFSVYEKIAYAIRSIKEQKEEQTHACH